MGKPYVTKPLDSDDEFNSTSSEEESELTNILSDTEDRELPPQHKPRKQTESQASPSNLIEE